MLRTDALAAMRPYGDAPRAEIALNAQLSVSFVQSAASISGSIGQAMPEDAMRRATELVRHCDLFLAIGSSLVVWPAAGFPLMAKNCGAKLVIINNEPTELDDTADLVQEFQKDIPQSYQIVLGGREVGSTLPASPLPTTYIIDRQGRIRDKLIGERSRDAFEAVIKPLLDEGQATAQK